MTPKEKAEEIFNRMCLVMATEKTEYAYYTNVIHAKQCALICIDEMLNISDDSNEQRDLEQVKQEIEKL
jgi:hypothetical protein